MMMTQDEFDNLKRGDIVRPKGGDKAYVVTVCYRDRVTAVASTDVTDPSEWDLIRPDSETIKGEFKAELLRLLRRHNAILKPPTSVDIDDVYIQLGDGAVVSLVDCAEEFAEEVATDAN